MATKSKNIKYSKGTKTAAVIIAVIMFFSSGYFANLFIRGFADYNAYDKGRYHYTHTDAFRALMNSVENYYISDFEIDGQIFDTFEELSCVLLTATKRESILLRIMFEDRGACF